MLGHKRRFSIRYQYIIETSFEKKRTSEIWYSELYDSLTINPPEDKEDIIEWWYLRSKLAVVLNDESFFDQHLPSNIVLIGYSLWRSYYLSLTNQIQLAGNQLERISNQISFNDFLLYSDFIFVSIRLFCANNQYQEAVDLFQYVNEYLSFLSIKASFTTLGIFHLVCVAYYMTNKEKEGKTVVSESKALAIISMDYYSYSKLLNIAGHFELRSECFISARIHFEVALAISRVLNDKRGEAERFRSLGSIEFQLGNYSKALSNYSKAKIINKDLNNNIDFAIAQFDSAVCLRKLGRVTEAYNEYIEVLEEFKNFNDYRHIVDVFIGLAIIAGTQGRSTSKGLNYYKEALQVTREHNLVSKEANILNNLGLMFQRQGDYTRSLENLNQSAEIYKELYFIHKRAKVVLNIADTYRLQGKFNKASKTLDTAFKLITEEDKNTAFYFFIKARLNYDLGMLPQARSLAESSLRIFQRSKSPSFIAISYRLIGKINYIMEDINSAAQALRSAWRLLDEKGFYGESYQSIVVDLAEIYTFSLDFDKSRYWLNELETKIHENKLELPENITARCRFIEQYKALREKKLRWNELQTEGIFLKQKEFFDLQLKNLLLQIRLSIQENKLKQALRLITQGQTLCTKTNIITLKVEMHLLKALVLTNSYDFQEALESCNSITHTITEFQLETYLERQKATINLIKNSRKTFDSLYAISGNKQKEFFEKKHEIVPRDQILEYLDRSLRLVEKRSSIASVTEES